MIEVDGSIITEDLQDILIELRKQLELNGIKRFEKFIDTRRNIQTNCPFHKDGQERKPSFGISKDDGVCHCFGCGWKGTLPEMISNLFGYDDFGYYGGKWLIRNFVSISVETRPEIDLDVSRNPKITKHMNYVSEEELDTYRYTHPYMYERKLTDAIINRFDIGYDKNTDSITFPVRDIFGNCLFIARRSVRTKFFSYPEGVEKPVYGLYELWQLAKVATEYEYGKKKQDYYSRMFFPEDIMICESMFDALTGWVYGKPAVALNGLGNELQFKQLREMPNRHFIIATDMDERGLKARYRIKNALDNKLVTEYKWDLSVAKDINEMNIDYFLNLKEYM